LLFDPVMPAIGARVSQDARTPFARQRRLCEAGFALSATMADDFAHL
jgi:hypothetical protein